MLAADVQKRAAKVGFEWEDAQGSVGQGGEIEWRELNDARESGDRARLSKSGATSFALVNVARYDGIDPEEALRQATKKFERRFRFIEAQAAKSQRDLAEMSLEEMDALWDEAKRLEDKESSPRS